VTEHVLAFRLPEKVIVGDACAASGKAMAIAANKLNERKSFIDNLRLNKGLDKVIDPAN
jgi:hypothetical protein